MRPVPTKKMRDKVQNFHFQIHVVQTLSFKMIYMLELLPYLGPKPIITLRNSFVFYWFLECSMSRISFSSLVTCRSFCENRSHIVTNFLKLTLIYSIYYCRLTIEPVSRPMTPAINQGTSNSTNNLYQIHHVPTVKSPSWTWSRPHNMRSELLQ